MENTGRILLLALVLALCAGIAVIWLDRDYRPRKIAETNRGVFTHIPIDPAADPADPPH